MDEHRGVHPRIGAVDVVPFIPLGDTSLESCVEIARAFARTISMRFDLPVYLYAEAAARADRVKLADVRRGQYEGLRTQIGQHGREPDMGPARLHPSAGATAVGARPFLIAWNINLDAPDDQAAIRIARRVRESGGGLPKVQANGFLVEEPERGRPRFGQVSMNLLDFRTTPMWRVYEAVAELAAGDGVALVESGLIRLAPPAPLSDVAAHARVPPALAVQGRVPAAPPASPGPDFLPL